MCGRYTDSRREKRVLVQMGIAQAELGFVPRYNVAPTQEGTVAAMTENGPTLRRARWGLVPRWAKDKPTGSGLINIRGETLASARGERSWAGLRRCLVLADGFFEWRKHGRVREPVYIRFKGGGAFAFGGLWERGNGVESFSIVTVEANELVRAIHDRMPLILPAQRFEEWLDPDTTREKLVSMLRPHPAEEMESFPVRSLVNSPRNDGPECVEPAPPGERLLEQAELGF